MTPIISLKSVCKNYGEKVVLKNISFDVFPGEVIGYIGTNGAGKSTTVKIICGLINDYQGTATVKDLDVKNNQVEVKRLIGYVPELAELYDVLTPHEFLGLMAELYGIDKSVAENRIKSMLSAFGLEEQLDVRMDTFSKGMKQKVLIISGLLHNPDIIILDEPLSGLDANSVIIVKELISKLAKQGKTIFYCSHIMDIVEKVSDRIILINDGEVVANGSFQELQQMQGNKSLENIFAQMTHSTGSENAADKLIEALS
jgi:ABC-2 type transport system ATP-binding protein